MRLLVLLLLSSLTVNGMDTDSIPPKQTYAEKSKNWRESPHSTRYFFGPSGYNIRQGEGYYQNTWILLNQVTYGFTDNFSTGVAVIPTFLFGADYTPVWATPKFGFPVKNDKGAIGAGALLGTVVGASDANFGILYGIGTLGSRNRNMSLGLGYGYADGQWGDRPAIMWSGLVRLSEKWSLQTENYFIGISEEGVSIITLGARWANAYMAIDFGLTRPIIEGEDLDFVGIPWLSITVPFKTKQVKK